MENDRSTKRVSSTPDTPNAVDSLAAMALARVARVRVSIDPSAPNPRISRRLLESVMDRSVEPYRTVVACMLKAGVTPEAVADTYVPEVARLMGEEWETDVSNFAHVTLGSARLQNLLRELDEIWDTGHSGIGADLRPLIRVVTAPQSQHTLGASVLATQLRRLGCSVRLQAGLDACGACDERDTAERCDAIFISASRSDTVEAVASLVVRLRAQSSGETLPIVLGGTLLEGTTDAIVRTGVDHLAHDCVSALEVCGIGPVRADRTGR